MQNYSSNSSKANIRDQDRHPNTTSIISSLNDNLHRKDDDDEEEELEMRAVPKGQNFDYEEELNFKIIPNSHSYDKDGLKGNRNESNEQSSNYLSERHSQNNIDAHRQSVLEILEKIKDPKGLMETFERYQPKNKEVSIAEIKASARTKLKRYKDCIYFGEIINANRQGKGIMVYADNRVYEGCWENNLKHGKGLEILAQGNIYEGQFLNGKPEGVGTFLWTNGEMYEGEWKNGLKHGSGMWKGIKNESYIGEWKNGKVDGYGIHVWRNGDRYEGELKGFLKHGHGTEKFVNGDFYVGTYINGKPDGYGEYYWSNGCQYKGHFKNGLRHGKGVWKKAAENSDVYDGEWINDKKCGQGTYIWASGNSYKGEYFNDLRHGYGEMYWVDGNCYKGCWEKGIQHGEGELTIPNKGVQKGLFENNVFVGEVNGDSKINSFEPVVEKRDQNSSYLSNGALNNSRNELPDIKRIRGRASDRSQSQSEVKRIVGYRVGNSMERQPQKPAGSRRQTLNSSTSKERGSVEYRKLKEANNLDVSSQAKKKIQLPVWKPAGKSTSTSTSTSQSRKERSYFI